MSFDFLIEMAWKSALISGAALSLTALLKSRAPADRSSILRVAVALLLLLPVLALSFPRLEIQAWTVEAPPAAVPDLLSSIPPVDYAAPVAAAPVSDLSASAPTIWDDPSLLFLLLYLGGVAMAAARLGGGLWTLRRWTREGRDIACPQWRAAFDRARLAAGAPARLRLMVSDEAPSPMSWGLVRPAILIDRDTLDEPEDAEAILAHEIAHVVRRDWAALMLTRIAAALFWFNPLVWLLEREVVQQAEEAADIEAAQSVEPTRYAQTLVHWAQFSAGAAIPANSIAPSASALTRRVRAILDARLRSTPAGAASAHAAAAGCASFAIAVALLQLVPGVAEAHSESAPAAPPAPALAPAPAIAPVPAVAPAPVAAPAVPPLPGAVAEAALPASPVAPTAAIAAPLPVAPPHPPAMPAPAVRIARAPGSVAMVAARPGPDEAQLQREIRAAVREAQRHGAIARAEGLRAGHIAREAALSARRGMAAGADGLERGAAELDQGAARMRDEAQQLRSRHVREQRIAESARRGQPLTHEQLLELIPQFREAAQEMTEGAREMRRAAIEMRREARN